MSVSVPAPYAAAIRELILARRQASRTDLTQTQKRDAAARYTAALDTISRLAVLDGIVPSRNPGEP